MDILPHIPKETMLRPFLSACPHTSLLHFELVADLGGSDGERDILDRADFL